MTIEHAHVDPSLWRPQLRFHASLDSRKQLQSFNATGGIAVFIDVMRSDQPDIDISGSQSRSLSFWETRSRSGFVTKPKFSAGLLTIRFVTRGRMSYLCADGDIVASPSIAALTGFDDLREVRASGDVSALSATIAAASLIVAHRALTGEDHQGLPALEPIADMARPGMRGLFCTVRAVHHRLPDLEQGGDLTIPLLQEVIGYQLLSTWPRRVERERPPPSDTASRQLRRAIDYIEANLATVLTLADVAAAAGVSVRSLQVKFKKELGRTPVQFIIERRLARTHEELMSSSMTGRSISAIAQSWGFAHMGDFGQRYRRLYGCTPSQTRRDAG